MPGTAASRQPLYGDYDDDRPPSTDQTDRETETPKSSQQNSKSKENKSKEEASRTGGGGGKSGGGWLGGILTKLSLRPPNQMILPDDKNPTIVWDAERKRWRNLDGDEDEGDAAPPPPPTAAALLRQLAHGQQHAGMQQPQQHAQMPPQMQPQQLSVTPAPAPALAPALAPQMSNIFKMQKGRHIKKSYVDVFNPSGAATRALPPAGEVLGPPLPAHTQPPPAYFVPPPAPHHKEVDSDLYHSGI